MTGQEFCEWGLEDIGVKAVGDGIDNEALQSSLRAFNGMLNTWAAERFTIHFLLRTVKNLAAMTASYTIGTGGAINIVRPSKIENATLIIDTGASPVTEVPIVVFSEVAWQRIPQKSLTGTLPQGIYFDRAFVDGLGRIYPWPIPTVATTGLVLYTPEALAQLVLATNYVFPEGYQEALHYQHLRRLAITFGKPMSQELKEMANETFGILKRSNFELNPLQHDPALLNGAGRYNIYTD